MEAAMWQETKRIFLQSAADVLHRTARILPSVLAMLIFFALAVLLALVMRWVVRRACDRVGLDRRLREWGVAAPEEPSRMPTSRMVARVAFWAMIVAGAFLGLSVIDTPTTAALSIRLVEYVPRALFALVILGVGVAASRFAQRSALIGAVNMGLESARLIALAARWLVVLLATAIALEHAGVGSGVVVAAFATLFGGIVLAGALAVGLGAKDLVSRSLARRFPEGTLQTKPGEAGGPEHPRVRHL